jgi:hypothetical protein
VDNHSAMNIEAGEHDLQLIRIAKLIDMGLWSYEGAAMLLPPEEKQTARCLREKSFSFP